MKTMKYFNIFKTKQSKYFKNIVLVKFKISAKIKYHLLKDGEDNFSHIDTSNPKVRGLYQRPKGIYLSRASFLLFVVFCTQQKCEHLL